MNNRHRRVAKLRKQELNAAKEKLASEYGVSVEQTIELVDVFVKTIAETAGIIFQNIGKAFCNIGTILSNINNVRKRIMIINIISAGTILILLVSTVSQQVELKHLKRENQLIKNMLQKTEFSFFDELDKYK